MKKMQNNRIITKHQYNEVLPHVDYTMTKKGKKVIHALIMLGDWAIECKKNKTFVLNVWNVYRKNKF